MVTLKTILRVVGGMAAALLGLVSLSVGAKVVSYSEFTLLGGPGALLALSLLAAVVFLWGSAKLTRSALRG